MLSPGKQGHGGCRGGNAVPGNEQLSCGHREPAPAVLSPCAPSAPEPVSTVV